MRELGSVDLFDFAPPASSTAAMLAAIPIQIVETSANILHGIINRKTGRDASARAVDVQIDVFLGIFRLQEEQLGNDQACDGVVDRRANKDNAFLQKAGEDIVSPFTTACLFDHDGDELVIDFFRRLHGMLFLLVIQQFPGAPLP